MPVRSLSWRTVLGVAALAGAAAAFSLGFACAVPLAAFAALGAMTCNRAAALFLVGTVWFANQCVGFLVLDYPWTADTFAWGGALGVVGLLAAEAAGAVRRRTRRTGLFAGVVTFLAAFAVYEGLLLAISLAVGAGVADFTPVIVLRIAAINAAAFGVLMAAVRLVGPVNRRAAPGIGHAAPAPAR